MSQRGKQWLGFLVMVIGAAFLLGPFLQGEFETRKQESFVEELHRQLSVQTTQETPVAEQPTETPAPTDTPAPTAASTKGLSAAGMFELEPTEAPTAALSESTMQPEASASPAPTAIPYAAFYQAARTYNRTLIDKGQWGMNSLESLEHFDLNAKDYGFAENVIGTISIPRIDVEVALYLGATNEHMAKGFAVFGLASVPLGEGEENVAIAGHRGWRGTSMLRDVQMILMGDPIYITTPWKTLTYIVSGIEIVQPDDNNWCTLQPGRTMISLMTCHPYGQHTHRYIVYADLQEETPEAEAAAAPTSTPMTVTAAPAETPVPAAATAAPEQTAASLPSPTAEPTAVPTAAPVQEIVMVNADGTRETVLIDTTAIDPDDREYSTVWSNTLIQAENSMRPIAYAVAAVVAVVGLWLVIATLRDMKKRKRGND